MLIYLYIRSDDPFLGRILEQCIFETWKVPALDSESGVG